MLFCLIFQEILLFKVFKFLKMRKFNEAFSCSTNLHALSIYVYKSTYKLSKVFVKN